MTEETLTHPHQAVKLATTKTAAGATVQALTSATALSYVPEPTIQVIGWLVTVASYLWTLYGRYRATKKVTKVI